MPHYAGGASTLCPYYRREGKTCIYCEGHSPGMVRRITFREREGKRRWQARCCYTMEYARRCPHARVLEHKYGNGKGCEFEDIAPSGNFDRNSNRKGD